MIDAAQPVRVSRRHIGGVEGRGTETVRVGVDAATRAVVVEVTDDQTGTVSLREATEAERANYVAATAQDAATGQRRAAAAALVTLPTPAGIVEYLMVLRPEDFA